MLSLALSSSDGPVLVNKHELAIRIGCSKPAVTALIDRYPDFPVQERGTNGKPWAFNYQDVVAFLVNLREERARNKAAKDEQLDQLTLPLQLDPVERPKGLSAREQMDVMRLDEMRLARAQKAGQLVVAAGMTATLTAAFAELARDLTAHVRRQALAYQWPDPVLRKELAAMADAQRSAVRKAVARLSGQAIPDVDHPVSDDEPQRRFA